MGKAPGIVLLDTVIYFPLIFLKKKKKKLSDWSMWMFEDRCTVCIHLEMMFFSEMFCPTEFVRSQTLLIQMSNSCQQKSRKEGWTVGENLCMSSKTYELTPFPENKKSTASRYFLLIGCCDRLIHSCFVWNRKKTQITWSINHSTSADDCFIYLFIFKL